MQTIVPVVGLQCVKLYYYTAINIICYAVSYQRVYIRSNRHRDIMLTRQTRVHVYTTVLLHENPCLLILIIVIIVIESVLIEESNGFTVYWHLCL